MKLFHPFFDLCLQGESIWWNCLTVCQCISLSVSQVGELTVVLKNGSWSCSKILYGVLRVKLKKPNFPEKFSFLRNSPKIPPRWVFLVFAKNSTYWHLFLPPKIVHKSVLYDSAKTAYPGKIWCFSFGLKPMPKTNQTAVFFDHLSGKNQVIS